MATNAETRLFCLIGHPTSGSKSPAVHSAIFEEMGINGSFINFDIQPENLKQALDGLKALDVKGFSVTIPYKETVLPYMDELHDSASLMGSVNSVRCQDGRFIGYNTDGDGLIMALDEAGVHLEGARVLVLGAGGAARGIVHALARQASAMKVPTQLTIWNRTLGRAEALAEEVTRLYGAPCNVTLDSYAPELLDVDLVINTTSIGMMPEVQETPCEPERFSKKTAFCDIVYKPHRTLMLRRAEASGHRVVYGIDMLIYQGILSEMYWHEGDNGNPFYSEGFSVSDLKNKVLDELEY